MEKRKVAVLEVLIKCIQVFCILCPIGISLPAYLRQGYVADLVLSEWGSVFWISFGLLIGIGFFTGITFLVRYNYLKRLTLTTSKFYYWLYSIYFSCLIVSAYFMAIQPSTITTFRIGQILFGIAVACGSIIIFKYNLLFSIFVLSRSKIHKIIGYLFQFVCSALILTLFIIIGYDIQWKYFSWLFVVMGLYNVWMFLIINLLGLFAFSILVMILKISTQKIKELSQLNPISNSNYIIPKNTRKYVLSQIIAGILIVIVSGSLYSSNSNQISYFLTPTEWAYNAQPSKYQTLLANHSIELPVEVQEWEKLYSHLFGVLESNLYLSRSSPHILFSHASEHFQKGWYWDTAFTALAWKNFQPQIAEQLLLDYISGAINPNGLVSHMYYPNCKSGISQPPLFAWVSMELYNRTQNLEFLRKMYPLLVRNFDYWQNFRDPENNSLYSWQTLDETGQDNTLALGPDPRQTEALDLSTYIAFEAENLATMASILHQNQSILFYQQKFSQIRLAIQEKCWDPQTNFFYSISKNNNSKIPVMAASGFLPLLAGIANETQANAIVQNHLLNSSEFWTPYPVPSTALSDPTFELKYWRGPVWINLNYLIAQGLKRYNFLNLSQELNFKTINMTSRIYQEREKAYELYHPITGNVTDAFNPSGGLPSSNMSWNAVINNIIIEEFLGIQQKGNELYVSPHIPSSWQNTSITIKTPQYTIHYKLNSSYSPEITVVIKEDTISFKNYN